MANEVNSAAQTFRVDGDSALDASGGSNIFRMEPAGGAKSTDKAWDHAAWEREHLPGAQRWRAHWEPEKWS